MDLIIRILREFRYFSRNKKLKKLISLVLIIFLLSILCSRVFAFELQGYNNEYLYFNDFSYDTLNTAINIDDFNVVILSCSGFSYNFIYFLPKQYTDGLFCVYSDNMKKGFLNVPDNVGDFTIYRGQIPKTGNNYTVTELRSLTFGSGLANFNGLGSSGSGTFSVVYSDFEWITYAEYSYCNYSLSLSTEDETSTSVFIYTNWLNHSKANDYNVYMEMYPNTANSINVALNTETNINNPNEYRYYFEAEENGDYKFYFYYDDGDFSVLKSQTITVSNIISNTGGGETGGNEGGGDTPVEPSDSSSDYTQNFNDLQQSVNNTTTAINNQTQAINETNNFLQNTTVDDSQFDMPTVEVSDPTANFFDTMFTGIYNAVTTNEDKTINISLFGNNISVNSADFNFLQGNEWSLLRIILSSMWTIGIGLYILKDIRKMIEKIKDGNIENVTNDDIKADIV